MKFVRTLAVLLLMLVLPLQAVAAFAAMPATCSDERSAGAQHSQDIHAGHAAGQAHEHQATGHQHSGEEPTSDQAGHSCCHHVFTGAAVTIAYTSPQAPRSVIQRVSLLHTLHIPEQPQRPPRA